MGKNDQYFDRYHRIQYDILKINPFFGKLLLSLPFGLANCGTAYTDMQRIVFDPQFMDQLSDQELQVVVLHELMHCVLSHCTRGKGKQHEIWNIACDIVVNSYIYEFIPIKKLAGHPFIHYYKIFEGRNYTADEIYQKIINDSNKKGIGGKVPGEKESESSFDRHDVWDILCKDSKLEDSFRQIVQSAYHSTEAGKELSNGMRKLLDTMFVYKIPWQDELHEFLSSEIVKEDYSFMNRDTRFFDSNFVIPSLIDEEELNELNQIYIAIDVSGSISDQEYSQFIKEIQYLCQILHVKGYYSFFDTEITEPQEFNESEPIKARNVNGYGGTNFNIIFDKAQSFFENNPLKAILVFTDGYTSFPNKIDTPVVWILNNESVNPPYGKVIRMTNS